MTEQEELQLKKDIEDILTRLRMHHERISAVENVLSYSPTDEKKGKKPGFFSFYRERGDLK